MLTKKQLDLLAFIQKRMRKDGVSPSFDEMKEALNLRSKSGIHRLITALEERGFIRRLAHRARAIEIIRLPDTLQPPAQTPSHGQSGFEPQVIEGSGRPSDAPTPAVLAAAVSVPIMGRIAAGVPIEAIQQNSGQVGVPSSMLGSGSDHYALEVKGDSMIEAGIRDGDLVVIRRQDTADNGDIVVALVEDQEATLKRFRRKGASVALEAANPAYETRVYAADQVRVQGRLVGLIRSY